MHAAAAATGVAVKQDPTWRVHIGTADVTSVRFALPPALDSDPWPLSRVVADVLTMGASRADRPHAVGPGRGVPIIHRQDLRWHGCDLHLEARHIDRLAEVSIELPPWDELTERVEAEDAVWELVDTVAAACDARWGALGDGEALGDAPDPRRHIGVLVPERDGDAFGITRAYAVLPRSGFAVVLR
ncbi:MAG: hypothetical protein JOZ75_00230 [Candidatus Dormibacteraeota bacterium]|nr:hypothetical protein [Candidatus Dormibacteraeota bacterium]